MPGLSVVSCPIRSRSSQTSEMHESRWEGASVIQSLSGTSADRTRNCRLVPVPTTARNRHACQAGRLPGGTCLPDPARRLQVLASRLPDERPKPHHPVHPDPDDEAQRCCRDRHHACRYDAGDGPRASRKRRRRHPHHRPLRRRALSASHSGVAIRPATPCPLLSAQLHGFSSRPPRSAHRPRPGAGRRQPRLRVRAVRSPDVRPAWYARTASSSWTTRSSPDRSRRRGFSSRRTRHGASSAPRCSSYDPFRPFDRERASMPLTSFIILQAPEHLSISEGPYSRKASGARSKRP